MNYNGNVIVIAGPTACGKTALAMEVAKLMNCDIVSVDSVQCYKYFDIGSAKPTREMLRQVKHYMIDEYSPEQEVNVYDYSQKAVDYIRNILAEGKSAVLCGGSGLYIDSIVYDSYNFNATEDESYRIELCKEADTFGAAYLYDKLLSIDPEYAAKTHKNNVKRVIRALEYYHVSNKKMSDNVQEKHFRFPKTYYFALNSERNELYKRIDERVDEMLQNGMKEETQYLYDKYYKTNCGVFNSIGYKEFVDVFAGRMSIEQAVNLIKQHSRNYAKRQYTWFRANQDIIWLEPSEFTTEELALKIKEVIEK